MESLASVRVKTISLKEPLLRLNGNLFPMSADSEFEVAVGDKVGKDERLGRRGSWCGGHWWRSITGDIKERKVVSGKGKMEDEERVRMRDGIGDESRHVL